MYAYITPSQVIGHEDQYIWAIIGRLAGSQCNQEDQQKF
jgi:hypothetical protein